MQSPESSIDRHDHCLVLVGVRRWVCLYLVHVAPLAKPGADLRDRDRERERETERERERKKDKKT